jgi:OFA family oxalate/formate antiporter-like MFS transporter
MADSAAPVGAIHPSRIVNRWVQLIAGIVAMAAIANLQYAWTLFVIPIENHLHVSLPIVQGVFAAFILVETWLVPFEGALIDRIGPRFMLGMGGVLVGLGWMGSGYAESIRALYLWYMLGGIGAGFIYGGTIGNVLKWFPDYRGLCVGLTAGAYGVGTAISVDPIAKMIKSAGYQHTFILFGLIQGAIVLVSALFLAKPPAGWTPPNWKQKEAKLKAKVNTSSVDMTPVQMVQTSSFWMIYLMMTLVAFGGLVVTAQLKVIATTYKVDKGVMFLGMTATVLAIELNRVVNGVTRPLWGWISDHIGRENAMFAAFLIEGLAIWAWLQTISHPAMFVILSSLVFFAWGEIFSLFPSITGDIFGRKWATTNYGLVYTAKGTAAIFSAPVAAWVMLKTGSWVPVFYVMIACDIVAAFLALLWLKPLARRTIAHAEGRLSPTVAATQVSGAA